MQHGKDYGAKEVPRNIMCKWGESWKISSSRYHLNWTLKDEKI